MSKEQTTRIAQIVAGESVAQPANLPSTQETKASVADKDAPSFVSASAGQKSKIGKMTISFGEPDAVYDRAIRSHELHNELMGYKQFVLRERIMSGLWTKHAYILSVITNELTKPVDERLKWVM